MKERSGWDNMEYGLIGSNLTHSFSKYLHEEFLNTKYVITTKITTTTTTTTIPPDSNN